MGFKWLDDRSIIDTILKLAGYTYGPLLGLFAFGMLTTRHVHNGTALVCAALAAPVMCYVIQSTLAKNPQGFQIGIELMILNGLLTFVMLWLISVPAEKPHSPATTIV